MEASDLISLPPLWWILCWETFLTAVSYFTWRLIGINRLNSFSFFFPLVLLTNGILLPFSRNINSVLSGREIGDIAFGRFTFGVALFYVCLPIGILLAKATWKTKNRFLFIENTCSSPKGCFLFLSSVALIAAVYLGVIISDGLFLNPLTLVHGFGTYDDYALHRYNFAAATSTAKYILYNKLPYSIAPLAVIIIWNWRRIPMLARIIGMGLISLVLLQTGHKLPLVFLLCICLISQQALKTNLRISSGLLVKGIGGFVIIIFAIIPFFYLRQGISTYGEALWWSVERVFGESYRALQLYFYTYPDLHAYLGGASQNTIAAMMGVDNFVPTAVYIPTVVLELENTSYPALFISDAWADFGFWGVAVASIACGFSLHMFNLWFFRAEKRRLEDAALLIAVAVSAVHLTYCNIITAFSTYGLGAFVLIYMAIQKVDVIESRKPCQLSAQRDE